MAVHRAYALFVTIPLDVAVGWITIGSGPDFDFDR